MPYDPEPPDPSQPPSQDPKRKRFRFDRWAQIEHVVKLSAREGDPVPTGIPWLDGRLRRGGITPGRLYGICGPPFAGKTTLTLEIALAVSNRIPVFALFSDEGRDQAAARLGVMLGVDLEQIEEDPLHAAVALEEARGERTIHLLEPDCELANARDVFDQVAELIPKTEHALIVLDSAQTIPPTSDPPDDERQRILELVDICRKRGASDSRSILITSKANRASYARRRAEENTVAAAAWSGAAIEYQVDFGIVLSLPDEASDIVHAKITKNRLGHFRKAKRLPNTLDFRFDDASGKVLELDAAEKDAANVSASAARLAPIKAAVLDVIKRHSTDGIGSHAIRELVRGRRNDIMDAIRTLLEDGKIMDYKVGRTVVYRAI